MISDSRAGTALVSSVVSRLDEVWNLVVVDVDGVVVVVEDGRDC